MVEPLRAAVTFESVQQDPQRLVTFRHRHIDSFQRFLDIALEDIGQQARFASVVPQSVPLET
jgi:hypothetical protein